MDRHHHPAGSGATSRRSSRGVGVKEGKKKAKSPEGSGSTGRFMVNVIIAPGCRERWGLKGQHTQ